MGRVSSLFDGHGNWCAYCLRYISDKDLEEHHVIPKALSSWVLPELAKTRGVPFLVPVHRGECHAQLQASSDCLAQDLRHIDRDPSRYTGRLLRLLEELHMGGFYALEFFLRAWMFSRGIHPGETSDESDEWRGNLYRCAAGLRWAAQVLELPCMKTLDNGTGLFLLAQKSNYKATVGGEGNLTEAKLLLNRAELELHQLRGEAHERADILVKRKRAILYNSLPKLEEHEVELARWYLEVVRSHCRDVGATFSLQTASVVNAMLGVKSNGWDTWIVNAFEETLSELNGISWQYKAELLLFRALHARVVHRPIWSEIYGGAVEAQFLYAATGTPTHCHLRSGGQKGRPLWKDREASAQEILMSISTSDLTPVHREEIRWRVLHKRRFALMTYPARRMGEVIGGYDELARASLKPSR